MDRDKFVQWWNAMPREWQEGFYAAMNDPENLFIATLDAPGVDPEMRVIFCRSEMGNAIEGAIRDANRLCNERN